MLKRLLTGISLLLLAGCGPLPAWRLPASAPAEEQMPEAEATPAPGPSAAVEEIPLPVTPAAVPVPEPEVEVEPPPPRAVFPLAQALREARYNLLEIQTVESLQELAGEHVENRKLLLLPDIISSLRSTLAQYWPDGDPRLRYLDDAIAYNYLLSLPDNADMARARNSRAGQLLDYSQLALWSRLAAVREAIELEDEARLPDLRREENSLLMELRLATGLPTAELEKIDFSTLAEVRPVAAEPAALQRYAAMNRSESAGTSFSASFPELVRKLYRFDRAAELLLAESLFRLPRKLDGLRLNDPAADLRGIAALACAVGAAFEVELDWRSLNRAYDEYRLHSLAAEVDPANRTARIKANEARLAWRLAWYRLLTDLGVPDITGALPEHFPEPGGEVKRESRLLELLDRQQP